MKSSYQKLITVILGGGSFFAWFTIYQDFVRFQSLQPLLTPCFYGGIAFLLGLYLSLKRKMTELFYLLIAGTIFAWGNFLWEVYKFYCIPNPVKISCSGLSTESVFNTPCFYGALIYLLAFITIYFYRKDSQQIIEK